MGAFTFALCSSCLGTYLNYYSNSIKMEEHLYAFSTKMAGVVATVHRLYLCSIFCLIGSITHVGYNYYPKDTNAIIPQV